MIFKARKTVLAAGSVALAMTLGACAQNSAPVAAVSKPLPAPVVAKPAPQPKPLVVRYKAEDATVWRLRSGLNVAALTCKGKGRVDVTAAYREMLNRHRALLKTAYNSEVKKYGASAFDRQQTRVYNGFSQQQSPEDFCKAAAQVASEANELDSTKLYPAAPVLVAKLERGLGG